MLTHDSIAYNKPLLNGVRHNAIRGGRHLWLQNSWSGTANASTSVLSDDDGIVATNLFANPSPISTGLFLNTYSAATRLTDTDAGLVITSDGTGKGGVRLAVSNPGAGGWHLHAELTFSGDQSATGDAVWFSLTDQTWKYSDISSGSLTIDLDGTKVNLGAPNQLVVTCAASTSVSTTVSHVGLYTATDWSAMQAKNITWFDGEKYVK